MSYLHQHRICHGRLKSLNCVLDDRWVCKITGKATLNTFNVKGTVRSLHRGIVGGVVFIVNQPSLPIKDLSDVSQAEMFMDEEVIHSCYV